MTDTSKLVAEATAISANSPKIRVFALDAAANVVAHEQRIAALEQAVANLTKPTPPPSGVVTIDPPVNPKVISDTTGIGLNIVKPLLISDVQIGATGDSAVIVEASAPGSSVSRIEINRACANPGLGWSRHGFYIAAPGCNVDNARVTVVPGPSVGQVFSIRCGGTTVRHFHGEGAPHIVGYFEQDASPGDVLVADGEGAFTADTAIWLDGSIFGRKFTFRNLHFTGNGAFIKTGTAFKGTYTLDGCTLNGQPV